MPRYLTVAQYKAFDMGMALPPDTTLAHLIGLAESDIDDFMGFDPMIGGFEPHTAMVQHRWDERTLKEPIPNIVLQVRVVDRYRIQVSNLALTGAGFFATINPADCVINSYEGYIEIVPLQAITYSLSPVILQLGLKPPIVQMDVELGFYIASLGETLYNAGDNQNYTGLHAYWASSYNQALATQPNTLPPVPPVVYKNGAVQSASLYSINYTEGKITFNGAILATDVVTADFTYQIPDRVRDATLLQTVYLLGQRALNQQGLQGLERARMGEQQLDRGRRWRDTNPDSAGMHICEEAKAKMSVYQPIAIA